MDLEAVGAVLEVVRRLDGLPGQLARLSGGHEAAAEPVGECAAEDEAARLRAEDDVRLPGPRQLGEPVDRLAEVDGVGDERHQVLEDDPGLGEVRHVADTVTQVECCLRAHRKSLPSLRRRGIRRSGCPSRENP